MPSAENRIETVLDTSGLICPLPVLKARKALREIPVGAVLCVIATDPAAERDFPPFCDATGNRLLTMDKDGEALTIRIERLT